MLEQCSPQSVFSIFEQFSAIPHGSRNTSRATAFCVDFARAHDLPCTSDEAGNVIIRKAASAGYENAPTVILQGHLDMVAAADEGAPVCLETDGLDLFLDGDLIGARGTTLGGDDGIAVAMILSILADNTLPHPALEAVFTTDEEIGMLGADALDMSSLRGKYLLNLDSEDEGVLTVSCAGGATAEITYPVCRETPVGGALTLSLEGLSGGHSGVEIHKGRTNAVRFLASMLASLGMFYSFRLVSFTGGEKDNAIPVSATATLLADKPDAFAAAARAYFDTRAEAVRETDSHAVFSVKDAALASPISEDNTRALLSMLTRIPCGVQRMSADIEGLVQTSLNLGILRTTEDALTVTYSVRSSVGSEKEALLATIREEAERIGAVCRTEGDYPAWEYKKNSPLRDTVTRVYADLYGREMKVEAIHAGLECGIFSDRIANLECVSLGPNMQDIHTTRERLSVSSVARTYDFVCAILGALK